MRSPNRMFRELPGALQSVLLPNGRDRFFGWNVSSKHFGGCFEEGIGEQPGDIRSQEYTRAPSVSRGRRVWIERQLDRLLHRQRPPLLPRRREGFLAQSGPHGSHAALVGRALLRQNRMADRDPQCRGGAEQARGTLRLPSRTGDLRQTVKTNGDVRPGAQLSGNQEALAEASARPP